MNLARVARVSRLKHVTKRVFAFIGADTLVVLIGDNWIPVRGDGQRKWINDDGTIRNVTADDFETLESMVECEHCLEHGTGACQGECC